MSAAGRTVLPTDPDAGLAVTLDRDGRVVTVTLERPDRLNAQTPALWAELVRIRRELPATVRVAVLQAAGRAFSAGLDRALLDPATAGSIHSLAALPEAEATARIAGWQQAFEWDSRPDLVSVAAVQGHAVGGGFQLALGADIRICADDVAFSMVEPRLGIVPDLGGSKRLVDMVGYSRAAEICLTGRPVGADEALRIGLASQVVPAGELPGAVAATVDALLAVDRDAATETKALLMAAGRHTQAEQQRAERAAQYRRLRAITGHTDD